MKKTRSVKDVERHFMTPKQQVLKKYPYAYAYAWLNSWVIYQTCSGICRAIALNTGDKTAAQAWASAAKALLREESLLKLSAAQRRCYELVPKEWQFIGGRYHATHEGRLTKSLQILVDLKLVEKRFFEPKRTGQRGWQWRQI